MFLPRSQLGCPVDAHPILFPTRAQCGAFHGDKGRTFLLQWLAASQAGRALVYCAFGDAAFVAEARRVVAACSAGGVATVGQLHALLAGARADPDLHAHGDAWQLLRYVARCCYRSDGGGDGARGSDDSRADSGGGPAAKKART